MVYNYDGDHYNYNALKLRQVELLKNSDTPKEHIMIPAGSAVTVYREEGEPWTHGTVKEHNKGPHDYACKIYVTKTDKMVSRTQDM